MMKLTLEGGHQMDSSKVSARPQACSHKAASQEGTRGRVETPDHAAARSLVGAVVMAVGILAVGCGPHFEDFRPSNDINGMGAKDASGGSQDGSMSGTQDGGMSGTQDGGMSGTQDGGMSGTQDGSTPNTPTLVARGPFVGRSGYTGEGMAELYQRADGTVELRFDAAFRTSGVPGPVVILSERDSIGGTRARPDLGDIAFGTLKSTQGAQSYSAPGSAAQKRHAWIYCDPFAIEIAVATLETVP